MISQEAEEYKSRCQLCNCSKPLISYNKTVFDQAGITEIPTRVDGILAIAEKLATFD